MPKPQPGTLILNVDDDEITRYAISQILRRGGYEVVEAPTAADALRMAVDAHPALVVLDINLPDGSGIDVCRTLKADPRTEFIPVLQVSATSITIEDQVAGLEGGADGYLTWPVDPLVLLATMRALLRAREAEAQAVRVGRQWQATMDSARDAIAVLDGAGRVVRANRRLAELVGTPLASLPGRDIASLLPAGAAALAERIRDWGSADARGPAVVEISIDSTWQQATLDRIDEPARVGGSFVLVLTDISEIRRALDAEREARLRLGVIVAQMPVGLLVADRNGQVILNNRELERMVGRTFEGVSLLEDETWAGMFEGEPITGARSPFVTALTRGARFDDSELLLETRDGARSLLCSVAPIIVENDSLGVVATFADITERKALEAIRDTFIGVLSHELRTPVTTILGGSRLLDDDRRDLDPAVRRELLHDITSEAERLHRLVEDLLVLARTERGVSMQTADPVLVQHIIPSVIASEQSFWPTVVIESHLGDLPTASGDRAYVEQVVRNLISNAAKYGGDRGPIEVAAEAQDGQVVVTVRDRGPGIASSEADRVFDLFYRSEAAERRASGAGIGLFVCRQLVRAMGGRIWVRPRDGGGTEFGFALPAYAEAEDGDPEPDGVTSRSESVDTETRERPMIGG